jgi:hypothetical protein
MLIGDEQCSIPASSKTAQLEGWQHIELNELIGEGNEEF